MSGFTSRSSAFLSPPKNKLVGGLDMPNFPHCNAMYWHPIKCVSSDHLTGFRSTSSLAHIVDFFVFLHQTMYEAWSQNVSEMPCVLAYVDQLWVYVIHQVFVSVVDVLWCIVDHLSVKVQKFHHPGRCSKFWELFLFLSLFCSLSRSLPPSFSLFLSCSISTACKHPGSADRASSLQQVCFHFSTYTGVSSPLSRESLHTHTTLTLTAPEKCCIFLQTVCVCVCAWERHIQKESVCGLFMCVYERVW